MCTAPLGNRKVTGRSLPVFMKRFIISAVAALVAVGTAGRSFAFGVTASSGFTDPVEALHAVDAFGGTATASGTFARTMMFSASQGTPGGDYLFGVFYSQFLIADTTYPFLMHMMGANLQRRMFGRSQFAIRFGMGTARGSGAEPWMVNQLEFAMLFPLYWNGVYVELARSALISPRESFNRVGAFWLTRVPLTLMSTGPGGGGASSPVPSRH